MDTDPDTFLLAYARVLRRHRKNMELSQEELAFRAGLSMRYISLLESGKHQPSLGTMKALADALDTSLTAMIGEAENNNDQA
ncbi:helix-turn-helix domain-containing protein [Paracoccus denitrificans]|jgi:transcriptional regulator with XRE-family HTH domain|nr:helix-turn-helix transcriptional regulator [Paracoccus denitrificans]MBB4629204.1 transcriptional regulator with XRE-family HTH domain [Paracoccus denitrificans]MCU7430161.1 helix-turn-helix transcriptional regulator [Paracoccus denitrificans]QAR27331.1 XRE family transcriptional regulator [Paracoccus denitrificans]UPV96306.1 helix-turn-helix transcriptional regulator [Paracoccus denitrificans]WQO34325.1 helix-turn-helix transcriptional regulator [Paracoccus denitrificans]